MRNADTNLHVTENGLIRIREVPPGEAPYEIRQKWVGLVLPVAPPTMRETYMKSLLTEPKTYLGIFIASRDEDFLANGAFFVSGPTAIEALLQSSFDAVKWWKRNAPFFQNKRSAFLFSAACCAEVAGDDGVWPPPPKRTGRV